MDKDLPVISEEDEPVAEEIRLPSNIQVGPWVGSGNACNVFRAVWNAKPVALKIYKPGAISRWRQKYGMHPASYEYNRNFAFHAVERLSCYAPRPLSYLGEQDRYTSFFVQEFVDGVSGRTFVEGDQVIPREILTSIREIIDLAAAAGIWDLDLNLRDMIVRETPQGWLPVVVDFNRHPREPTECGLWNYLRYKAGLRRPTYKDDATLRKLKWRSRRAVVKRAVHRLVGRSV